MILVRTKYSLNKDRLHSLFLFQRYAFLMPSVGSSLAIVTAAALTCLVLDLRSVLVTCFKSLFPLWVVSAVHQISSTGKKRGREDHDPSDDDRRGGHRGNAGLAVAEVHPGIGRPGGRAARSVIRNDARRLDDVAPPVLPTAAIGRGTISNSRNPQASELLPGGRLVVNFHDDPGWDHSRLFRWPIDATTWIVLTPNGDADRCADYSRARVPLPWWWRNARGWLFRIQSWLYFQ